MICFEFGSPASVIALARYGRSNCSYRIEDTVSGRMAATLPEPCEARTLIVAMVEKSSLKSVYLSFGTCDEMGLLDELDAPPQAATNSAALLAMATEATALETERKEPP